MEVNKYEKESFPSSFHIFYLFLQEDFRIIENSSEALHASTYHYFFKIGAKKKFQLKKWQQCELQDMNVA